MKEAKEEIAGMKRKLKEEAKDKKKVAKQLEKEEDKVRREAEKVKVLRVEKKKEHDLLFCITNRSWKRSLKRRRKRMTSMVCDNNNNWRKRSERMWRKRDVTQFTGGEGGGDREARGGAIRRARVDGGEEVQA